MKYSTFRSKTCEPSRCSRIALFVSGVIQFSRPISSSGPHGLFETLTPSRSRIGSNTYSPTMASLCVGCLELLDQRDVQLRAAVAEEVQLVLAGNDVVLVPRLLDVDVGDEERLRGLVGLGEPVAVGVDDLAPAAELAPPLLAHPVRDQEVDAVLAGARGRDHLGLQL